MQHSKNPLAELQTIDMEIMIGKGQVLMIKGEGGCERR